jgi:hypothetical protein
MGHSKGVIAAAGLLAMLVGAAGCTTPVWVGKIRRAMREPGQELVDLPAKVERQYDCDEKKLPFFRLEKNELNPNRVPAGGEFNHRMVYSMCPEHPTDVVAGTLVTLIRFKGKPIVTETLESFEIKPGRWIVDAFITLPEDAEEGVYALELRFTSESAEIEIDESLTFGVDAG